MYCIPLLQHAVDRSFPNPDGHWTAAAYSIDERRADAGLRRSLYVLEAAVACAADGARPLSQNVFKPALLRRTLIRALMTLAA